MTNVISLEATPERLHSLLDERYAGFAIWEAIRLADYETACQEGLRQLRQELSLPIASRIMENIGFAYYFQGDYKAALDIVDQIIPIYQVHPIVLVMQAECLGRLGRRGLASDLLFNVAESEAASPEIKMFIAGSLHSLGSPTQAMRIAAEACSEDPYQACYMIGLSYYTYQVYGLSQSVVSLANQAVRLEPTVMEYRVWLSRVLVAVGQPSEAYSVIANATRQQIHALGCSCCVAQLCLLFEAHGDMERVKICLELIQVKQATKVKRPDLRAENSDERFRNASTVLGVPFEEDRRCQ